MYELNEVEQMEYEYFCKMLNNKDISTYIKNGMLFIVQNQRVVLLKKANELSITDVNNIMDMALIDNKYLCYFIKRAYENEKYGKIKSLRL